MERTINTEEMLVYEQERDVAIWEAPLSSEVMPALSKITMAAAAGIGQDMGVGNNYENDGTALPKLPKKFKDFKDWASVAATINRKSYALAALDPTSTQHDDLVWAEYNRRLRSAPFWRRTDEASRSGEISSFSLSALIDAMSNLVAAYLKPSGLANVEETMKKIAQLAVENEGSEKKDTYSQTGLISVRNSELYVCNTRAVVSFVYKKGKGYEQLKQKFYMIRFAASLDFGKCERSADTILKWDQTDADDWASGTASNDQAPNESPAWDN